MVDRSRLKQGIKKVARTTKQGASQAKQDLQGLAENAGQGQRRTDQTRARIERARQEAQQEAQREAREEFQEEYKEELKSELREEEIGRLRSEFGLNDDQQQQSGQGMPGLGLSSQQPRQQRREPRPRAQGRDDGNFNPNRGGIPLGPPRDSGIELRFMGDDDDGGFW